MLAIISAIIFAACLCADCFAVSVCSSVTLKKIDWGSVLKISLAFGVIQAGLMAAGFLFGGLFVGLVESIAKWIGFLLLLYVGGSMVGEALAKECEVRDLNGWKNIVVGGVATSIDALAVGISLSMSRESISDFLLKDLMVFLVTMLSVIVGMFFGHAIGHKFGKIAEFVGGVVLILIGANILLEFL